MPALSLTDFVDFVTRTGTPRLTKVRQVQQRGKYHPASDFWRGARQAIVAFHKRGSDDSEILDKAARGLADPRKAKLYPAIVAQYKTFLEKKRIEWFDPPKDVWQVGELVVRVNPELGLRINGQPYVIKLHFREEELTKQKTEIILLLMDAALREHCSNGERFALLDVRNGTFITSSQPSRHLTPLLESESLSFMSMWNHLDQYPLPERRKAVSQEMQGEFQASLPVMQEDWEPGYWRPDPASVT